MWGKACLPPHFYHGVPRLQTIRSGMSQTETVWFLHQNEGVSGWVRYPALGKLVDRAGFEPAYPCESRFTVSAHEIP